MDARGHRRVLVLGFVAVLAVATAIAVLSASDSDDAATAPVTSADRIAEGLCASVRAAEGGDLRGAHGIFLNRVHTGLHEIAAAVEREHRVAAARLLERKNAVEVSLPGRSPTAAGDLRQLFEATADGLSLLDEDAAPTCQKETNR